MGVDLDLIPYERAKWPAKGMVPHFEDNEIRFPRWYEIYEHINAAKPKRVPDRVFVVSKEEWLKEDSEIELCTRTDPYGSAYTYLPAGKLHKAILSAKWLSNQYPDAWNQDVVPALKQLARLKPSTPVILSWG